MEIIKEGLITQEDRTIIVDTLNYEFEYRGPVKVKFKDASIEDKLPVDFVYIKYEGDYMHGHLYLDHCMKFLGYVLVDEQIKSKNLSNWYTSIHYYVKEAVA